MAKGQALGQLQAWKNLLRTNTLAYLPFHKLWRKGGM
jgi:hypothetical protein